MGVIKVWIYVSPNPCNDVLRDCLRQCPRAIGLDLLQQVEGDWTQIEKPTCSQSKDLTHSGKTDSHRTSESVKPGSEAECQIRRYRNIIHPAGSSEQLNRAGIVTNEAYRCQLSEAVNVEGIRAAKLPRTARIHACTSRSSSSLLPCHLPETNRKWNE